MMEQYKDKLKKIIKPFYIKIRIWMKYINKLIKSNYSYIKLVYCNKRYGYDITRWEYIVFDHSLGGGATQALEEKLNNDVNFRKKTIVIRYIDSISGYQIVIIQDQVRKTYMVPTYKKIERILNDYNFNRIYVNELFEYDNVYRWLELLKKLKELKKCDLIYMLHDYYCICPISNLMLDSREYCALKYECKQCLANYSKYNDAYGNIDEWRKKWGDFLKECTQIIAFSINTRDTIQSVYKEIKIDIIPHQIYKQLRQVHIDNKGSILNIGILGNLSYIKGLCIVKQMVRYVLEQKKPIKFILIGDISGDEVDNSTAFCKTGRYKREDLPKIVEYYKIDIILVASVIPETFSYTTHEAIMMNLPTACFNLGAQAECVKKYDKGIIIPEINYKTAVETLLNNWRK